MLQSKENIHKLLALVLLLLAIAMIFMLLVFPLYARYQNTEEEIASLQHQLLQYKSISGRTKGLSDKLAQLEAFNEEQEFYFSENKVALASAELQGIIKDVLNLQNANILSTQPVTAGILDDRQIKVAVHCRADIVSLRKLLYEIETYVPVLIIDKIKIGRSFRTTFGNELSDKGNEILDVRFDVTGYMAVSNGNN